MAEKTASLATQAYDKIKENILNLTYPPGTPLTESLLAAELGMGYKGVTTAYYRAVQKLKKEM